MQTKSVVRLEPECEVAPDNPDDCPSVGTAIIFVHKNERNPLDKSNECSYHRRTQELYGGASAMTMFNVYEPEERTISDDEAEEMYAALSVKNKEKIIRQIAALKASQS